MRKSNGSRIFSIKFKLRLRRSLLESPFCKSNLQKGVLAQLGERDAGSVEVRGSIPLHSTSKSYKRA